MVKNVLLGFSSVALAVASAAGSYSVTFYEPATINGTELKAGSYKLEVEGNTAMIRQNGEKKTVIQAPVKVEQENQKFSTTSVRRNGSQIDEIRLGGTNMKVVFENSGNATN